MSLNSHNSEKARLDSLIAFSDRSIFLDRMYRFNPERQTQILINIANEGARTINDLNQIRPKSVYIISALTLISRLVARIGLYDSPFSLTQK